MTRTSKLADLVSRYGLGLEAFVRAVMCPKNLNEEISEAREALESLSLPSDTVLEVWSTQGLYYASEDPADVLDKVLIAYGAEVLLSGPNLVWIEAGGEELYPNPDVTLWQANEANEEWGQ